MQFITLSMLNNFLNLMKPKSIQCDFVILVLIAKVGNLYPQRISTFCFKFSYCTSEVVNAIKNRHTLMRVTGETPSIMKTQLNVSNLLSELVGKLPSGVPVPTYNPQHSRPAAPFKQQASAKWHTKSFNSRGYRVKEGIEGESFCFLLSP